MIALFALLFGVLRASFARRADHVLENLLLRQQLAVALRPPRRPRLRKRDKLFWALVRRFCTGCAVTCSWSAPTL